MYKDLIKEKLNEVLDRDIKDEIKTEIKKTIKSSDISDIIKTLVAKELKGNKDLEKEVIDISRNILTQLYKTLWVKRGFWQSSLKNKTS